MTFLKTLFLFALILQNYVIAKENCESSKKEKKLFFNKKINKTIFTKEFFNLPIKEFEKGFQFKYLVFKVKSKDKFTEPQQLFFSIQDNLSNGYWSQLNHVTEVQNGESIIYVDLQQLVGERGSQKKPRRINYSKIKKVFLYLDSKGKEKQRIKVSDFFFYSPSRPSFPSHVKVFDFRIKNKRKLPCVKPVDDKDKYSAKKGYGFKSINVWRKEDSQYLDSFLSSVIFVNDGEFAVDLKNGTYEIVLFWNTLGYWAPPFFSRRKVLAEDIPMLIQDRSEIEDYEKSFFIFEDKEPTVKDHPWDWLYNDVMRPITKIINITDGQLNLKFSGDASGVALNGLIINKVDSSDEKKKAIEFIDNFKRYLKSDYSRKIRSSYLNKKIWKSEKPIIRMTQNVAPLNPFENLSYIKSDIKKSLFSSRFSTFLNILLQVPFEGNISFDWKTKEKNSSIKIISHKGRYSWVSLDRNHESYTLETQVLLEENLNVSKNLNQQFVLELKLNNQSMASKIYIEEGILEINIKEKKGKEVYKESFPLKVTVLNQELPPMTVHAGFIGLNGLKYSYYPNKTKLKRRRYWDLEYLKLLSKYGFNTFTGLPTDYNYPKGLSYEEITRFLNQAEKLGFKPPYYTYGGEFLHSFFEHNNLPGILKEKKGLNSFLKQTMKKDIVFQFSDEATGYSQNVARDLKRAKFLKKNFPMLNLGGFTQWTDKLDNGSIISLNKTFDVPSFSHLGFSAINFLSQSEKSWGLYNQAQGGREDPYLVFGRMLWELSLKKGFTHYLEWHSSAIQNLPYFDLDGREADVAIAIPSKKSRLNKTIKFIQSTEGIQDYRWLSFLSSQTPFSAKKLIKIKKKFSFRQEILKKLSAQ